jgi:hypothetical protein
MHKHQETPSFLLLPLIPFLGRGGGKGKMQKARSRELLPEFLGRKGDASRGFAGAGRERSIEKEA